MQEATARAASGGHAGSDCLQLSFVHDLQVVRDTGVLLAAVSEAPR